MLSNLTGEHWQGTLLNQIDTQTEPEPGVDEEGMDKPRKNKCPM